jgi:hypothetical protein
MLYANVSGRATAGAKVVQLDVRALRDGGTDETALQTYTAAVKPDGSWRCRITATWFGGDPGSSMHWQIMPDAQHQHGHRIGHPVREGHDQLGGHREPAQRLPQGPPHRVSGVLDRLPRHGGRARRLSSPRTWVCPRG